MRTLSIFLISLFFSLNAFSQAIIADHTIAKLDPITESAILQAKESLHIAYGHTSHGSQLITGMTGLIGKTTLKGYKGDIYRWNEGGTNDALDIRDYYENFGDLGIANDLGNPNRTAWEEATRTYLADNTDINVIMWSWCGQAGTATETDITTYLNLMQGLETDFPNVKFVYMTGHLAGTGETGNLHLRNEQIRTFCKSNNKILFDFADIESYDPDGNYYLDKAANDNCDYDADGNGSRESNWATAWQSTHNENIDWYNCSAAHSQALNGNLKAYAAWWLWARLGGWNPGAVGVLTASPASALTETNLDGMSINLSLTEETFADNSLSVSNFTLSGVPSGTHVESVNYIDASNAAIVLSYDGTDFDQNLANFKITIKGAELLGGSDLTSNSLTISAKNETLQISASPALNEFNLNNGQINVVLTDDGFIDNSISLSNITLNNKPAGLTVHSVTYTDATHAKVTFSFNGTDFDSNVSNFTISISGNELIGGSILTSNSLTISAKNEALQISSANGLYENSLNNAKVNLVLTDDYFTSNQIAPSSVVLNNAPVGLSVQSVSCTNNTHASVTLAFNGTDFDSDFLNFSISVSEGVLAGYHNLTSNTLLIKSVIETKIEKVSDNHLKLFPNPGNGKFTLQFDESIKGTYQCKIFDSFGNELDNKEILNLSDKVEFDYQQLPHGQYYLMLYNREQKIIKSFIIK